MRVSVVIPNWNGLRFLLPLFEDLRRQSTPPEEIVLVDNGSTDGSWEWAESAGARIVRFEENRGFAAAVNRGVAETIAEAVAVLNNDVRLAPRWVEATTTELVQRSADFVTGKILMEASPFTIDGTYDALSCGGTAFRCGSGQPDGPLWAEPREIRFPPFTAVMLRKAAFFGAGGLDETYESYLEDVDFGLRCASKGYSGRYLPEAVAWHTGSGTLGRWHPHTVRQISRNQVFLLARHYTDPMLRRFGWKIAVAQMLWGAVAMRHGAGLAWLKGKLEGVRRFRSVRGVGVEELAIVLENSESEIRRLQEQAGADMYWRLYFALT